MSQEIVPLIAEVEMEDLMKRYDSVSSRSSSMGSKSLSFILEAKAAFQAVEISMPQLPKFEWESSVLSRSLASTKGRNLDAVGENSHPVPLQECYTPTGLPQNAMDIDSSLGELQQPLNNFGVYKPTGSPRPSNQHLQNADTEAQGEPITKLAPQPQNRTGEAPTSPITATHFSFREPIPFERLPGDHEPPQTIASVISRRDSPFTNAPVRTQQSSPAALAIGDEMDLQPDVITVAPRRGQPRAHFEVDKRYGPSAEDIESLLNRTASWRDAQVQSQRRKSSSTFTRWASVKSFTNGVVRTLSKRGDNKTKGLQERNVNGRKRERKWRERFERLREGRGEARRLKKGEVSRVYGRERMVISDETLGSLGPRRGFEGDRMMTSVESIETGTWDL